MNIDIMAKTTVYKSNWIANGFDVLFSVIYLLERYKDLCVPLSKISKTGIENLSDVIIYWTHNRKKPKVNDYIMEYPGGKEAFKTALNICLMDKKTNFVIVPIGIKFSSGSGGHFNIILIDKKRKTIERFEPYGVESIEDFKIMSEFEKIFKKLFTGYKLYGGNQLCPDKGLQSIEENAIEKGKGTAIDLESDPVGYCIAWSIYYVDMRLTYREIKPMDLIKLLIKNLAKYKHSLRTFIRNYSTYLVNEKNQFLKKLDKDISKSVASKNFSKGLEKRLTNYFIKKLKKKIE